MFSIWSPLVWCWHWYNTKSIDSTLPLLFAEDCRWDGEELCAEQTQSNMGTVWGRLRKPDGSSHVSRDCSCNRLTHKWHWGVEQALLHTVAEEQWVDALLCILIFLLFYIMGTVNICSVFFFLHFKAADEFGMDSLKDLVHFLGLGTVQAGDVQAPTCRAASALSGWICSPWALPDSGSSRHSVSCSQAMPACKHVHRRSSMVTSWCDHIFIQKLA